LAGGDTPSFKRKRKPIKKFGGESRDSPRRTLEQKERKSEAGASRRAAAHVDEAGDLSAAEDSDELLLSANGESENKVNPPRVAVRPASEPPPTPRPSEGPPPTRPVEPAIETSPSDPDQSAQLLLSFGLLGLLGALTLLIVSGRRRRAFAEKALARWHAGHIHRTDF
jgi:hypothetical protein